MLHDECCSDAVIRNSALVGLGGLALCGLLGLAYPGEAGRGYLVGFLFWLGIAAGSLGILMVYHLTGGGWGRLIRRPLESAAGTLPLLALLFVPLALAIRQVYPWAGSSREEWSPQQQVYLNAPGFFVRAAVYFVVWAGLALLLARWSRQQDRTQDPRLEGRLGQWSGPGLVVWGLAYTFAAIDWVMSLEPRFSSTIFGLVLGMGQVLAAMAFAILCVWFLRQRQAVVQVLKVHAVNDLASLLLALVMFWAYVAFSQLLLVWAGNLPEETVWYLPRGFAADAKSWRWVGVALGLLQFALPFWLLLFPRVKRNLHRLAAVAGLVLAMAFVNLLWQVFPAEPGGQGLGLLAGLLSLVGVGGVWLAVFLGQLRRSPLVAARDLATAEASRDE